jgi:serine phosphatase RsbU (regulator of sigma subunit)
MNDLYENIQDESLENLFGKFSKQSDSDINIVKNPYKFLDSYTLEDKEIFFGRDKEIDELYRKFYSGKSLLIYGQSGTGKSSVVNCGMLSRIPSQDIYKIDVRCGNQPLLTLSREVDNHLNKGVITLLQFGKMMMNLVDTGSERITKGLAEIYSGNFKPIAIIFDQFEEVFIFSSKAERYEFAQAVRRILDLKLNITLVFIIREEYYACLTEFEPIIPEIFRNRSRIEKTDSDNAKEMIEQPCKICNVMVEEGVADFIIDQLRKEDSTIELTYLQIIMDKLYREALALDEFKPIITIESVKGMKNLNNILSEFLNNQIDQLENSSDSEIVLKAMISSEGTKALLSVNDLRKKLSGSGADFKDQEIIRILRQLINLRIVKDKDEQDRYELRHDSLALAIFNRMSAFEREFLEIRQMFDNRYSDYKKRKILLDKETLENILPFSKKLNLTTDQMNFLDDSKIYIEKSLKDAEKKDQKIRELENLKKIRNYEQLLEEKTRELKMQNEVLESANNDIRQQKLLMEDLNRNITASINYAARIQRTIMPERFGEDILQDNGFIWLLPKDIVSGDLFWIKNIDGNLILIVGDCTGHGVPGAIMSILGITIVNSLFERNQSLHSDQILNELKRKVEAMLVNMDDISHDGIDMSVVIINNAGTHAEYSGAFLPLVIVRDDQIIDYKPDRQAVSFSEHEFFFMRNDIDLKKGDMIYLYTDGFTDQFGGTEMRKFKASRLKDLFLEIHNLPAMEQKEILKQRYYDWKGDAQQIDDVLILGYKI